MVLNELPFPTRRDAEIAALLDGAHFRFRRDPLAGAADDETEISSAWALDLSVRHTALTAQMRRDFEQFFREGMAVSFATESDRRVVWRLEDPLPEPFDRTSPDVEKFTLRVSDSRVEIEARHERGLLQGTHHLEWLMADRGGPFLKKQTLERTPAWMPRITNGTFIPAHQTFENPGYFSDAYLGLMSHYGANGLPLYADLMGVFQNKTLPELNSPDFSEQIKALRNFNRRTLAFGIDIYWVIAAGLLPESHPVFAAHPETRGARVEICQEELSGRPWRTLCSGNAKVQAAYSEALDNLLSSAPEIAGVILSVGGESFYHCFTRPAGSESGETNCPHCRGKSASREVARLVNTVARTVKGTGKHKIAFAWPYSAFTWSKGDFAEIEWIRSLEESVAVISNFDCHDADVTTGGGARLFDYNIKCPGPSKTFASQAAALRSLGRPIFTKTETCVTPDAFFLPWLPLYFRWHERFVRMKQTGVRGFIGQWRFFGVNGSPPEELQYRLNWANEDCEDVLRLRCARDFGLEPEATDDVISGWRILSEAWENYPYSAMTSGERSAYMRGPFYLGPAHPLIFDVQDAYQLPESFFRLRGDVKESILSEEELRALRKSAKPRYVSDLLLTLPFGVERYLELVHACRNQWEAGLALLRPRLDGRGEAARQELNICETVGAHLRSLENVVRFYSARDHLQNVRTTKQEFLARLDAMQAILNDEVSNAELMLGIVENDARIGYGYCYGPVYDAEMIRQKLAQCRRVRDVELPRFSQFIRFHVWGESP